MFDSLSVINDSVVEHATHWEWAVQKYIARKHLCVRTEGEGVLVRIVSSGEPPDRETFEAFRCAGLLLGCMEQISMLYYEVKFNIAELVRDFNLSADGLIDFKNREAYCVANARYHNAILSINRFVIQSEGCLNKTFGKESNEVKQWKEIKKELYDNNLAFGFCLEERNHVEHAIKPLALMNEHPVTHVGGLGINLESDYMHYDKRKLDTGYSRLRSEFIVNSKAAGKRPIFSVARMVRNIQFAIIELYLCEYTLIRDGLKQALPIAEEVANNIACNGLLIMPEKEDTLEYHCPRRILRWNSNGALKTCDEIISALEEAINSYVEQLKEDIEIQRALLLV